MPHVKPGQVWEGSGPMRGDVLRITAVYSEDVTSAFIQGVWVEGTSKGSTASGDMSFSSWRLRSSEQEDF